MGRPCPESCIISFNSRTREHYPHFTDEETEGSCRRPADEYTRRPPSPHQTTSSSEAGRTTHPRSKPYRSQQPKSRSIPCPPMGGWINQCRTMYDGILPSFRERRSSDTCYDTEEASGNNAQWNEPVPQRQTSYDSADRKMSSTFVDTK